jgi:hypothetical protein
MTSRLCDVLHRRDQAEVGRVVAQIPGNELGGSA